MAAVEKWYSLVMVVCSIPTRGIEVFPYPLFVKKTRLTYVTIKQYLYSEAES